MISAGAVANDGIVTNKGEKITATKNNNPVTTANHYQLPDD